MKIQSCIITISYCWNWTLCANCQLCKHLKILNKWKNNYWIKSKTFWQKEKLLTMSNFSIYHNVFESLQLQRRQKASVCGIGVEKVFCSTKYWKSIDFIKVIVLGQYNRQSKNTQKYKALDKGIVSYSKEFSHSETLNLSTKEIGFYRLTLSLI